MKQELSRWLADVPASEVISALAAVLPGVAVIGTDAAGRVACWSPEAERLLGGGAEDRVGGLAPPGLAAGSAADATVFGASITLARPDGGRVSLRHFRQAIKGSNGSFAGAVHALFPQDAPPGVPLALPSDTTHFHGLISRDPSMFRVFDVIRNVAATDVTVLVRGESGTGKELVARAIHDESHRKKHPFVAVNCASFSPGLLESELFGHKKGAFTGAVADRAGIFAQADGGTLFLDEVAEIPMDLQSKLLRVLQERVIVPVGGNKALRVDVRVIAATHRSLREEVRAGRFREDLMYRLRVVPLFLPPLRERSIDVELLLRHFIDEHNRQGLRQVGRIAPDAMRALLSHRWPGNIRELRNVVDHAFAMGRGPEIRLDELPPEFTEQAAAKPRWRGPDEATAIREALDAHHGDLAAAAAALGMGRTTLWRKRKALGLG